MKKAKIKFNKTIVFGVVIVLALLSIVYFKIVDNIKTVDVENIEEQQETKEISTIQDRRDALREVFK